jgi:uncharacterized membrane protein
MLKSAVKLTVATIGTQLQCYGSSQSGKNEYARANGTSKLG